MYKIGDIVVCIKRIPKSFNGVEKYKRFRVYQIMHKDFYPSTKLGGPKDKETSHYTYKLKHIGKYSRRGNKIIENRTFFSKNRDRDFCWELYNTFATVFDSTLDNNFALIRVFERENKIEQVLK